jgi:hypothetical protein
VLEAQRNELVAAKAAWLAEQEAERERHAAVLAEIEQDRAALQDRETELAARRATLELAARVLSRRAALVEADAAEMIERRETAAVAQNDAEERSIADRQTIERLEAQVITWRDEAEHWKSRFADAESRGPVAEIAAIPALEDSIIESEPEAAVPAAKIEPVVERALSEPTVEEPVADEYAAEEPIAAEAAPVAPVERQTESAADVLRRLGMATALNDDDAGPSPPPAAPRAPQTAARPEPQPKPVEPHEGEESLDDYMQQLFQRLGVKPESAPAAPAPSPSRPHDEPDAAERQPAPEAAPQSPLTAGEFKARSVAAERKSDLSTLRELANVTAHAAIAKHQVTTQSDKSKWTLTAAVSAFALSGIGGVAYVMTGHIAAIGAAVACLAAGLYFGVRSAGLKHGAAKSARSLDDVLHKSAGRAPTKEVAE